MKAILRAGAVFVAAALAPAIALAQTTPTPTPTPTPSTTTNSQSPVAIGPADLQATIYHHLGISRDLTYDDTTGRPQYILPPDQGQVIKELL